MPSASSARSSFVGSLDAVSSLILRNLSRLGMDLSEQKQWSKVFLVVERGTGTDAEPYNGAVIDCSQDASSMEFEDAFMREWWTQRRPFISAAASKNGSGTPPTPPFAGSGGKIAPRKAAAAVAVPAACPSLEQHSPGVMQSLNDVKMGSKTVTEATINAMLSTMGMTSINQVVGKRLRIMSSAISATMDARTAGDVQWSWSRIVPIDMLLNNYWTEDKKVEVTLFSLFPPWHRDACKLRLKQIGVLLAASLCKFWKFFLFSAFDIPTGPDGEAVPRPAGLKRAEKKRQGPDGGRPPPAKKGRPPPTPKDKGVTKAKRKRGDNGLSSDAEDDAPPAPDNPLQVAPPHPRPVSTVAALGDSLTVEELARDGREEAEAVVRGAVIEPAAMTTSQPDGVVLVEEELPVLLPRNIISSCYDLFPTGVAHVDGSAAVTIKCSNHPTMRISFAGLGTVMRAHSYNERVGRARRCFKWLGTLSGDEGAFAPGLGPLLSPATSMKEAALDVRSMLGRHKFGENAWRYYKAGTHPSGEATGGRLYGGQTITYGDVVLGAQAEWMTNGLIDAALVELRVTQSLPKLYIMLTAQSAAILRTTSTHPVSQGAAVVAAGEIAAQAGDCDAVAMVVNLCNNHWVAIIVNVVQHEVTVCDSLTGPPSDEKALAVERAVLLGNAVLHYKERGLSHGDRPPSPSWDIDSCVDVVQSDGYNCGAFAFARVQCAALGLNLNRFAVDGDLLRLAMVRYVLLRGRVYEEASMVASCALV